MAIAARLKRLEKMRSFGREALVRSDEIPSVGFGVDKPLLRIVDD